MKYQNQIGRRVVALFSLKTILKGRRRSRRRSEEFAGSEKLEALGRDQE